MKNKILRTSPLNADLGALTLRLILGGLFIYHGVQKIQMYDTILPMFTDLIGIGSKLSFNLLIFAEFFCGFLVLIGFFTRLSVLPILFAISVAYFIAHQQDPFMKKELAFSLMVLCIPVFILGSGKYSADRLFFKKKSDLS